MDLLIVMISPTLVRAPQKITQLWGRGNCGECWYVFLIFQHDYVLDCTKPQDVVVCSVGTTVLRRADCVGLGTNCELEATVSNIYTVPLRFACANVILLLGCKLLPFIDMLPCWTEGMLWFRLHLKGYSTLKWKFCHHILTPMLFQSFMNFFLLLNRKEDI